MLLGFCFFFGCCCLSQERRRLPDTMLMRLKLTNFVYNNEAAITTKRVLYLWLFLSIYTIYRYIHWCSFVVLLSSCYIKKQQEKCVHYSIHMRWYKNVLFFHLFRRHQLSSLKMNRIKMKSIFGISYKIVCYHSRT